MQRIFSTKLFKVFFIILFFLFLIFLNPQGFFNPFRGIANGIFLPFQKVFYSLSFGVANGADFLSSIGQLKNENEKLLKQNQELLAKNAMFVDMQAENAMLREQIRLLPREKFELEAAMVVSQDSRGMGNWLEIDKGSKDGIVEGMPVIVSDSVLLGKIGEVGMSSSKIMLLTNSKSTVSVMTSQKGTKGIAKGEYGLGIIFDMILQTEMVTIGDDVITSGIGGEIPRGLYVGSVQEIHASDDHLFQQAVISSPLAISKLQAVFVIKGNR
jgi:rod shape-determining protein MreC